MDAPTWQKADEWFAEQSEERQREILGAKRFEMYKNGTPLSAFGEKKHDDIWGASPKVVTLADLGKGGYTVPKGVIY